MCHDDNSRPPAPPSIGAIGEGQRLTLTASDGNKFMAYAVRPASPTARAVVILPDVRGLHAYYCALADRFAEAGFAAVALDYFGRTADTEDRAEPFEFWPHVEQTTPAGVAADTGAAVEYLQNMDGSENVDVFTVGFCFGGGNSWRQAADTPGLAGCIGFYGRVDGALTVEEHIAAPLLCLLAGEDKNIRPEQFDPLLASLAARGIDARRFVYEGAPHSFFDRSFAEHEAACTDAWGRILEFTEAHSHR
jgi:carboxymethylenebutenolidase